MTTSLGSGRRGLAALTAAGILWGSIGLVVRLLEDRGSSAISVAFWRVICAFVVLAPLMGRARLRELARQTRSGRVVAVALGSLAFQVLYFLAVRDVGVAVATLIALGLAPVVITAAETLAARTRPTTRTLLVLLLALGGLVLVTAAGRASLHIAPHPLRGVAEAVLSGLMYAASTSWSAPLTTRLKPIAITFATTVAGIVVLLPVVAITDWHVPSTGPAISGTIWLGLVTTVIAYGLFYAGLRSTPGSVAMILTLLEPVVAVVLAAVWLHEPLTVANLIGGVLLLAAVVALYRKPPARS